jgi:hypothetical protein
MWEWEFQHVQQEKQLQSDVIDEEFDFNQLLIKW